MAGESQASDAEQLIISAVLFFFNFRCFFVVVVVGGGGGDTGSSLLCTRLSLVVANGGYSSLQCLGFSMRWLVLLWNTGSRCTSSVVVVHGLRYSSVYGIFTDQALGTPSHFLKGSAESCT